MPLQVELGGERFLAVFTVVDAPRWIDRVPFPGFALFRQVSVCCNGWLFLFRHRSDGTCVRFRRREWTDRRAVILKNDTFGRDAFVVVVITIVFVVIVVVVVFSFDVVAVDAVGVVVEAEQKLDIVGPVKDVKDVRNINVVKLPVRIELRRSDYFASIRFTHLILTLAVCSLEPPFQE